MQKQTGASYVKTKKPEIEVNPEKTAHEPELEEHFRPEEKRRNQEQLDKMMASFLAKGGKIEKVKASDAVPQTAEQLKSVSKHFKKPKGGYRGRR
jgi:hypothetical protein